MSRENRILSAFVLILLAAVLWIGRSTPQSPEETADEEEIVVTEMSVGDIKAALLVNEKGSVAVYAREDAFDVMDPPEGAVFSQTMLKAFVYQMAHLRADRVLGQPEEWAEYGLEDYSSALVLLGWQGERVRLFMGSEAPFGSGYYLRREGDPNLYLVSGLPANMLGYDVDALRDVRVLPQIGSGDFSQITRIVLERDGQTLEIRGTEREGAAYFTMISPFEAMLDWQTVMNRLVAPLASLQMEGYMSEVPAGETLARLTIEMNGSSSTLVFLKADEDFVCCTREGGLEAVLLGKAQVDFLECRAEDLVEYSFYARSAADTQSVSFYADGISGTLELSGEGENLRSFLNGRTLNQSETLALFKSLTLLPATQLLEETESISGESLLTLSFALKTGETELIQLVPHGQRQCAVVINGSASVTTYRSSVEEILRVLRDAISA
ncbi:MAG: DUF4340 domain-containing protein [Clostridia bacterium]|nr:DUF4340 domain-containing protein [Clostridia bacterium]